MEETALLESKELSFEFFPAQTDQAMQRLTATARSLAALHPAFCSVTFGAGGSEQSRTLQTVSLLKSTIDMDIVPHISCVGATRHSLCELLRRYQEHGFQRLVVLRGDVPEAHASQKTELPYARDLLALIHAEFAGVFDVSVACYPESHPESAHADEDFEFFRQKVEVGADRAITQYFYNIEAYACFMERVQQANIRIPIIPGIMPIHSFEGLQRFSQRCGADLPRWLVKELMVYQDDPASLRLKGIEIVTRLCERLLSMDAPGLHFYTLNQAEVTSALVENCRDLGFQLGSAVSRI